MKRPFWLYWLLIVIAGATMLSGITQMLVPWLVLGFVGGVTTGTAPYFFSIIGMFMLLFGALMLHALLDAGDHPIIVFWASMQKLGAAMAVGVGVASQVFTPIALAVAGFDLISGLLMLTYWKQISRVVP
jgi:hypothetical protein